MVATLRYGESFSFHSTIASSIGISLGVGLELDAEVERRVALRSGGRACCRAGSVSVRWRGFSLRRGEVGFTTYFTAVPAPNRYGVALQYGMSRWQVWCGLGGGADGGRLRMRGEVHRRAAGRRLRWPCSSSRNSWRRARQHHGVAEEHEVLLGRARRQVVARHAGQLIDMPRMSCSLSDFDVALANRMQPVERAAARRTAPRAGRRAARRAP